MTKIVVIGGGHGLSSLLRGVKLLPNVSITAIVSVADDGGSTGRITRDFNIPAVGDIRNVIVALSDVEPAMEMIMDYRFPNNNTELSGHNLGNLILTALMDLTGDFYSCVKTLSSILKVQGNIIPASNNVLTLYAMMNDGVIVRGESNIPTAASERFEPNTINTIFYQEEVTANPDAVKAIYDADYVILGIGSLYTSIIPVVIIDSIKNALQKTKAHRIYICNAMSQTGETQGYDLNDHIEAINKHADADIIDTVFVNTAKLNSSLLDKYALDNCYPITYNRYKQLKCRVIQADLIDNMITDYVRHDPLKLAYSLRNLIYYNK